MRDRKKAWENAAKLVEQMTVDEMISQLRYNAPAIERLGVEEYNWWNEGLHGVARSGTATVFPQAIGLAATWNEELAKEVANAVATEARAKYNANVKQGDRDIYKGLTLWSPNINIFRDPRWGRGHETFGEDPFLTSKLGCAYIRGLQGDGEFLKTAACAKHFAVHSGPEAVRHAFDAKVNDKDLYETYLPAFEAAVKEAKVEAVMGAYNRTNGEPCCANHRLMTEILRKDWGFEGHYVSDCWAIRDFHEHHGVTKNGVQSSAMALNAGCDLNCGCSYLCLKEALNKNLTTKKTIKQACTRLFTTRYLLGMFEGSEFDKIPYTAVESKEHLDLAKQVAAEGIVLLKNDGLLPLDASKIRTIGVIGPNANSRRSLDGNYHGTASRYITALEGVQDFAKEDIRVLYSAGCHLFKDREEALAKPDDRISEALTVAMHSDVILLCLGLDETLEGEEGDTGNAAASGDKADLRLPKSQMRLTKEVLKTGKPVIVCIFSGSAMDLNLADEKAGAVIQAWYPGARGGAALADILFGRLSPSGKLPVTFYRSSEELPEFTDYSMKGRTYRYMENEPLYSFGFGLSYADIRVEDVSVLEISKENEVTVKVRVSNRSEIPAKEVLQIYVKNHDNAFAPPHPALFGFRKITLLAGEEKEYTIVVGKEAFEEVNEQGVRVFDSKSSDLFIGFHAPDTVSVRRSGKKPFMTTIQWQG